MTDHADGIIEKTLRDVLEFTQFANVDGGGICVCAQCFAPKLAGHGNGCQVEAALALSKTQAEKQAAAAQTGMKVLDSLVAMLSGMAIQDGMPPQAVTLYKMAADTLEAYREARLE